MFRLLARLNVLDVDVPPAGSTDDVDTWEDAAALGINYELEADVKSQEETLEEWCRTLLQAFELEGVEVDVNEVLAVAGVAAHSVVRPRRAPYYVHCRIRGRHGPRDRSGQR